MERGMTAEYKHRKVRYTEMSKLTKQNKNQQSKRTKHETRQSKMKEQLISRTSAHRRHSQGPKAASHAIRACVHREQHHRAAQEVLPV